MGRIDLAMSSEKIFDGIDNIGSFCAGISKLDAGKRIS